MQRVAVLCGLAVLTAVSACGDRRLDQCTEAYQADRYEDAARLCEEAHQASGDLRAGLTAAKALARIGEGDRALAWVEKLRGTSAEPGVWSGAAAIVYLERGETDRAAQAFRHDLKLLAAANDHAGAARAHYGLYFLALQGSRYREALEEARLAFAEAGRVGDRDFQADAAEGLYIVLYALGDLVGARRALDLATRLLPAESPRRARFLANQGGLAIDEGRPELARRDIQQALDLAGGQGERRFFRSIHLNLVQADVERGYLHAAERHLEAAAQYVEPDGSLETALLFYRAQVARLRGRPEEAAQALARALAADPVPDWAWQLEHERGRLAEAAGDLRTAAQAYERSAAIVEEMRGSLGLDELKAWLIDRKRQPFESLFLLHARAGRGVEALAAVERAKAGTFQDALVQATAQGAATPDDLWTAAADRAEALRDLLPAMSRSPAAALLPVETALRRLGERRLLVYFEARGEIWRLDVARGQVRPLRLDAPLTRVRDLAGRFQTDPDDPAVAEALGALLLPADLGRSAGETLHVVPDGTLTRIPFAALRHGGRWLVEDRAVVYVPGVSFLATSLSGAASGEGPPVVLADPRGNLPAAAAEGREIAALLGTVPRLGPQATAAALAAAARAPVLHVAGHAGWSAGGPWLEMADGQVVPAAILTARVHPRLVVLASCASAFPAGRGLWGSPGAAFLAAGSGAVLAALGSVEDRTARELVLRFYRQGGAADPARGLARAQREMLAAGRPPSSWAPFILLGAGPS
jgi:tetratricopeptide (TPR) repeat protein